MELRPTEKEELFLNLGYNRFYDLFEEVMEDEFWGNDAWYRFSKITNAFAVYSELLNYEAFDHVLDLIGKHRPPMESEIGGPLFKFIRNVLIHFPVFSAWDEVWISKSLVNWHKDGQSIDRFLNKYCGHQEVKYRFWEAEKKKMIYMSIQFPSEYNSKKIYLKNMLSEKDGVKFSFAMMQSILNTQVESINEKA